MIPLILHYARGGEPESTIVLPAATDTVVLGSDPASADVCLSGEPALLARHLRLRCWLSAWWVESLDPAHPVHLRGRTLTREEQIRAGDVLTVGNTGVRIDLPREGAGVSSAAGVVRDRVPSVETQPPDALAADDLIRVLVRVSDIAGRARSSQSLVDGCLSEMREAFRAASRRAVLLVEDHELVVRAASPEPSTVSFSLAREAIRGKEAFLWQQGADTSRSVTELDTLSAVYAPMLCGGRAVGLLFVASHLDVNAFTTRDVQLLSVLANTMGPASAANRRSIARLPQAFFSYARADWTAASRIIGDLRRRQIKVWFDERLQTGIEWRRQLELAIERTDGFVMLVSRAAVASEVVRWELTTALNARKTVVPLVLEACDMPAIIRPLHFKTLGGSDVERAAALDAVVERLHRGGNR